ncbi:MAG: nickel-dependent hydrogenase large subunit [Nanoarchaeota archaeon]|nr:nickel-dependent hydrogenase large subunit [Nanoarchaeota archaeon]
MKKTRSYRLNPALSYTNGNKMKKKSQLQIMQSTMILLLVFVLFAIGLIFFFSYQSSKMKEKEAEYADLEMIKKSQTLNFFPELQCSFDNIVDPDCFDMEKIESFIGYDEDYYYRRLLGNVKIVILKFDMENNAWFTGPDDLHPGIDWDGEKGFPIYNNEKEDGKYTKMKSVNLPISLYEPKTDRYYFGMIKYQVFR